MGLMGAHQFSYQIESTESEFSQPLREYILYTEAIKSVLRRRDAIQMEYEMTREELKRKRTDKDQVCLNIGSHLIQVYLTMFLFSDKIPV